MSQGALAASRLAASVRPGRADGYPELIAARLRRLAAAGRTGALPFTGHGGGVISNGTVYFNRGRVVFAESARTPGPAGFGSRPARSPGARPGSQAAGHPGVPGTPTAALAMAEPIADATLDLLASQSSPSRFRSAKTPVGGLADGFCVESLLAEVARRQHILGQLAGIVEPDTTVVRNPRLRGEQVQVSALQWGVLIRVRDGATARALAWELGRSVFGMTMEVYRLLALGLLATADAPAGMGGRSVRELSGRGGLAVSFLRAVSGPEAGGSADPGRLDRPGEKGGGPVPVHAHAASTGRTSSKASNSKAGN